MSNAIEQGRGRLRSQEDVKSSSREIFTTAMDLLEAKGQPMRCANLLVYRVFQHTVSFPESEISVTIVAGANLEKAQKVSIRIQGVGMLQVRKTRVRRQEEFKAREYRIGYDDNYAPIDYFFKPKPDSREYEEADILRGYLNAVRQVQHP